MSNNELSALLQKQRESSLIPVIQDKPGYIRPMSISEAVGRNPKSMLTLQKERGLKPLIGWVKGRLIELFTYLGAFDIATEYQIQVLATRICTKFFYWTPAELDYAFIAFASGTYGKLTHYNHDRETSVINPQDIMKALIDYEKDLLVARGKREEERMKQESERKKAEEAKKPHGLEAWNIYCEKAGLDPATHKLASVKLHDVNEELYPERDERGIIKNKPSNK